MKNLIAGNWKMNGDIAALAEIMSVDERLTDAICSRCDIVVCPPATLLWAACATAASGRMAIGAQDCHAQTAGAFTGDLAAPMLAEAGAEYIIVGHSERRDQHGETDAAVAAKARAAIEAGTVPIICVGESRDVREHGDAIAVVSEQTLASLPDNPEDAAIVIAYEPIWAIGTGLVPDNRDISQMHDALRALLVDKLGDKGANVRILYGGSMKPDNAAEILAIENVNGGLIGGASLKADSFFAIIEAALEQG